MMCDVSDERSGILGPRMRGDDELGLRKRCATRRAVVMGPGVRRDDKRQRKHLTCKGRAGSMRANQKDRSRESFVAYSDPQLSIKGTWRPSHSGRTIDVLNPATEESIGTVAHADRADLDEALAAAAAGFKVWRAVAAFDRCKIMRKAAAIMRERNDEIAPLLTMEQGKTLAEAKMEAMAAADVIEWFAEEAKRAYGRLIPARGPGIYQMAIKEPVGPVAAFTPWNFPINQVVRKLSAA